MVKTQRGKATNVPKYTNNFSWGIRQKMQFNNSDDLDLTESQN